MAVNIWDVEHISGIGNDVAKYRKMAAAVKSPESPPSAVWKTRLRVR